MQTKKEKRREQLALKAYEFIVQGHAGDFSINMFLESISMSKGNFYHYFKNKDDLYYEIINVVFGSFLVRFVEPQQPKNFEETLHKLFFIYVSELEEVEVYMKFIYEIYPFFSNEKNQFTYNFMQEYYVYLFSELEKQMQLEIDKGTLKEEILTMIKAIAATADGMYTHSCMLKGYSRQEEVKKYFSFICDHYSK